MIFKMTNTILFDIVSFCGAVMAEGGGGNLSPHSWLELSRSIALVCGIERRAGKGCHSFCNIQCSFDKTSIIDTT